MVQVTGIEAVRVALGRAGDSLMQGLSHARASDMARQRLPLLVGRGDAMREVDASIRLASTSMHAALEQLDTVVFEPGSGSVALDQVRAGVRALARRIDDRLALTDAGERFAARPFQDEYQRASLADLASGLGAASREATAEWAIVDRPFEIPASAFFANRRTLADLDPDAARFRPFVPEHGDQLRNVNWAEMLRPMLEHGSPDQTAARDVLWNLNWEVWGRDGSQVGVALHADDLRRMVAAVHPDLPADRMPAWLRDAGSQVVQLDEHRAADLAVMRFGTRRDAELGIAAAVMYDTGLKDYGKFIGLGELFSEAARHLPEGVRPIVPRRVSTEADVAMNWARRVRSARAREFVADKEPSPALIRDLLDDIPPKDYGEGVGAALVARTMLDRIPRDGRTTRDAMLGRLGSQLSSFILANERSWHVDYAGIGAIRATSDMLAKVDALPVRSGSSAAIAGSAAPGAGTAARTLTW